MAMSDRIIIKNGTVVTMNDADDVIFGGTVVIEGDRITDVGTAADVAGRTDESGATVIDATDKAVMPGPGRPALPHGRSARAGATTCRCGSTWRRAGIR